MAAALLLVVSAFLQCSVSLQTRHDGVIHGDATKYVFYAYNLRHHGTFSRVRSFGSGHTDAAVVPDKLTLPGYPAFLSLFVRGTPDQALVRRATLAQAGLGVASTLLAFLIALRLLPLGWALAAGLLVATLPQLAVVGTHLMTEPLYTPLMLAAVLAMLHAATPGAGRLPWVAAGLLLGLAGLVRPQLLPVPLLVLAVVVLAPRLRIHLPKALLGLACFLVVVGPWQIRNLGVERPAGDPDLLAASLYHGSFPGLMYQDDPRTLGYAYRRDPEAESAMRDLPSALHRIGRDFAARPGRMAHWYLLGKPGMFLSWGIVAGVGDIFIYRVSASPYLERPLFALLRDASFLLHWPLMLLALAATAIAAWRPRLLDARPGRQAAAMMLAALFAYVVLLHTIGAPYPRYNIPFRPLAFVLAMVALRALWLARRPRPYTHQAHEPTP